MSLSPWKRDTTCIIESTRCSRSCCRSCESTIRIGLLRIGVVFQHQNGFVCIEWHHVICYPHVGTIPLECLDGFNKLSSQDQDIVLKLRKNAVCEPSSEISIQQH
ncbi:unnamed protein product [Albugo candida]|uniref:PARP-type domain-containing protein n=1 Tax=Albugo candida TaxID=65357 RepID=A0A024G6E0_9STRA|nr:unnamed protein product [Albugo candida]|eukprot:CCI42322.1 unnamed protein product [Albugo candida]